MQKSKEELIKSYNSLIGDTPTEEQLTFMEDLSDSFVTPTSDDVALYKEKYEAVLQKYRERFLGNDVQSDIKQTPSKDNRSTEITDEPDTADTINPAPEFKDIFTTTYIRR